MERSDTQVDPTCINDAAANAAGANRRESCTHECEDRYVTTDIFRGQDGEVILVARQFERVTACACGHRRTVLESARYGVALLKHRYA